MLKEPNTQQMSLTFILKRDKNRTNLKDWLRFHFPNPRLNIQKNIIVNPNPSLGSYAGEIGTAFDYLFRFNLERINKRNLQEKRNWVAESGLKRLINKIESRKTKNIIIGYNSDKLVNRLTFKKLIIKEFNNAETNHKKFIEDGILTKELIKSTIILAKLDLLIRINKIDANFDVIEIEKIHELEELFNIVPWDNFKTKENCLLNPAILGACSELDELGGADADIILDDTLIDIKTNREFKLEREDLNQVIGYCLLAIIGKLDIQIKNIGIYYARYGYLWQMSLTDFYELERLPSLAEEFRQLIKDKDLNLITEDSYKTRNNLQVIGGYIIDKDDFKCPHCESKNFIKNGTKAKKFRYKCKDCNIGFSSTIETNSIEAKSTVVFNLEKKLDELSKEYNEGISTVREYKKERNRLITLAEKLPK